MAEIVWVGPGWYKLLTFPVGNKKVVQVSQNRLAALDSECFWFDLMLDCVAYFNEPKGTILSKRIMY